MLPCLGLKHVTCQVKSYLTPGRQTLFKATYNYSKQNNMIDFFKFDKSVNRPGNHSEITPQTKFLSELTIICAIGVFCLHSFDCSVSARNQNWIYQIFSAFSRPQITFICKETTLYQRISCSNDRYFIY